MDEGEERRSTVDIEAFAGFRFNKFTSHQCFVLEDIGVVEL